MKKMLLVAAMMFIAVLLNKPQEINAVETTEIYSVLPGDPEWEQLGSVENKIRACSIDEDVLSNLSDEELVQAVLDYPFVIDIFATNDHYIAVQSIRRNSDAFQELLSRDNAKNILLDWIGEKRVQDVRTLSSKDEMQRNEIMILLMYTNELQEALTEEDVRILEGFSTLISVEWEEKETLPRSAQLSVTTPKGTAVPYSIRECSHPGNSSYHSDIDQYLATTYNVTLVAPGTCKYNCHSYAWYSTSTNNTVWIDDPSAYMTDGSYNYLLSGLGTFTGYVDSGAKVCYGTASSALHSAILTGTVSNVPLSNRTAISKWGPSGVFIHNVSNVPAAYWDSASNISVWH